MNNHGMIRNYDSNHPYVSSIKIVDIPSPNNIISTTDNIIHVQNNDENHNQYISVCHRNRLQRVSMINDPHRPPTTKKVDNNPSSTTSSSSSPLKPDNNTIVTPILGTMHNQQINCSVSTSSSITLSKFGKKLHQNGENFECEYCEKTFKRQDSLKSHLKIHLGTAYKCQYCNKLFSRKSNLSQHILIHTKARPFQCGYCNKTFRQKHALSFTVCDGYHKSALYVVMLWLF